MRTISALAVLSAVITNSVSAVYQGFNYGAQFSDDRPKMQSDFEAEFKAARYLVGAPGNGFTSARLYSMVQWKTAHDVISAIPAAIATNTTLLLGIWCSAGPAGVTNELAALKTAIGTYGEAFTSLVVGILRRRGRLRETVKGTPLEKTPVGHVDTWTEWTRSASQPVLDAVDWVGVDAYSYWQDLVPNGVAEGKHLFDEAMGTMTARVGAKPVWITETGFPVSGGVSGDAVPSVEGARQFWAEVGCPLFGTMNVWWYTLRDAPQKPGTPSFGILGANLTQPLFDISCKGSAQAEPEDDACDAV